MTDPAQEARQRISIIVSTRNRAHCMETLLERIVPLTVTDNVEVLVFDDASTDRTPDVCARFGDAIRYVRSDVNVGNLEARRRLIDAARGEFIAQLDDDSYFVDANAMRTIRTIFSGDPSCCAIAANIAGPGRAPASAGPRDLPFEVPQFTGCGVAFRTADIRRLGSYPRILSGYGAEETALSLRILDAGLRILFVPQLRVVHDEDAVGRDLAPRRKESLSNELTIVFQAYPALLVWPAAGVKLASHAWWNLRHSVVPPIPSPAAIARLARSARASREPVAFATMRRFYGLRRRWLRHSRAR